MHERLSQPELAVRFHHLEFWRDVVIKYEQDFGELAPWQVSGNPVLSSNISSFIDRFVRKDVQAEINVQRFLEDTSLPTREMRNSLRYLYDCIGKSEADYQRVIDLKMKTLTKIFDAARQTPGALVELTFSPDDLCKACAVGKHCKAPFINKITKLNKDYFYRDAVINLMNTGAIDGYKKQGQIRKNPRGEISLTVRVLFDPAFHSMVLDETERSHPSW